MDVGTIVRLSTQIYNESGGKVLESRLYFNIPASGAGTDGTNYDAAVYGYDDSGRRTRVKELRKVKNQSSTLLAEYRYNGLGHMIGVHEDTDADGDADGSDVWFYPAYDEGWREVARYREGDSSPKEQFVNATAGPDGYGGSSYINDVVCRNRDNTSGWLAASDGTLEERYYYCPNWRGDVSALVTSGRLLHEMGKYSPYGIPFGLPGGDTNSDGDNDSSDATQIQTWIDGSTYDVRGDVDLDGDVDSTDKALSQAAPINGNALGWGSLSDDALRKRIGYAGYVHSDTVLCVMHVRQRAYTAHLGKWAQREPLDYVDGPSLYHYAQSRPATLVDPHGTQSGAMHAAAFLAASGGSVILQKPPKPDKKPNLPPDSHNGEILGVWLGRCKFFNDEEDFVCVNVRIDDVVACICRWIGDQF